MSGIPALTLRQALNDKALLGNAIPGPSWFAQRTLMLAALGEVLTDEERELFQTLTGRSREPLKRVDELWEIVGRRGGKSRAAALLAVYHAIFVAYNHVLAPGERAIVLCLAKSMDQAEVVLNYAKGFVYSAPLLAGEVRSETGDSITFANGISIEVRPSSFRGLRGKTFVCVIADEAAFWPDDSGGSRNPDSEVFDAVRPGLATTGGMLIVISSPYARKGEVWATYQRHFGEKGDPLILVAQAASRVINPSLPQSVVDRAMERDAASAAAEYGAQFRTDIESFVRREAVEACVELGVFERAPLANHYYFGFVDLSGGGADSMTLGVSHREGDRVVLDAVREIKPPLSPEAVVSEFSVLLKSYRVSTVRGDAYAGEWPREQFRKRGVSYDKSDKNKSEIYGEFLPMINSARAVLLDDKRLVAQLCGLERRTSRLGKDSIDHAPTPGAHDDLINSAAGALTMAIGADQPLRITDELLDALRRPRRPGDYGHLGYIAPKIW